MSKIDPEKIYSTDKTTVSKTKNDMGKEEWWCNWYQCNKCTKQNINGNFKYCPDCGRKIRWVK